MTDFAHTVPEQRPLDIAAAIAGSNMITRRSGLRRFGQDLERRGQQVGVSLSLL